MEHQGDLNSAAAPFHGNQNQKVLISSLINSVYFTIGNCFIMFMHDKKKYRLLAVLGNKVLADCVYPTLRGARIAFKRKFIDRAWYDDVAAEWSHFYTPDQDWIEEHLSLAATSL